MNIDEMRDAVKNLYPGPKWAKRVSYMPDHQIFKIYQDKFVEVRLSAPVEESDQLKFDI